MLREQFEERTENGLSPAPWGWGIWLSLLIDLKPFRVRSVELITRNISTVGHVCQHGSCIVWPLKKTELSVSEKKISQMETHVVTTLALPFKSDDVSRIGISHLGSWSCVETTREKRVGGIYNGAWSVDLSNDTGGNWSLRAAFVRGVAFVSLAIDSQSTEGSVGRNESCGEKRDKERRRLHNRIIKNKNRLRCELEKKGWENKQNLPLFQPPFIGTGMPLSRGIRRGVLLTTYVSEIRVRWSGPSTVSPKSSKFVISVQKTFGRFTPAYMYQPIPTPLQVCWKVDEGSEMKI